MVTIENLTKTYGPQRAVDDVSFTCAPGTVTGFLGPNGAGTSTTLRMIRGLPPPSPGRATVGGVPYRTSQALTEADLTSGESAGLAVSTGVWVVLPLTLGAVRVLRREVS